MVAERFVGTRVREMALDACWQKRKTAGTRECPGGSGFYD
jgi:hypothetical protein